ncbi:ATP-binding protein [Streptomyces nigra]
MLAAAERTVSDWLAEPRRSGSVLSLLGPFGMGKTELLRRMHERFPSSIFMDCSGLTMDEVTRRLLAEFGIDAVDPRSKDPLFDAVVKIRRDAVVLLANVHWSGPLFTSREPDRIAGSLVTTFGAHSRGCVRVVVEADAARDRVRIRRASEIRRYGCPGAPHGHAGVRTASSACTRARAGSWTTSNSDSATTSPWSPPSASSRYRLRSAGNPDRHRLPRPRRRERAEMADHRRPGPDRPGASRCSGPHRAGVPAGVLAGREGLPGQ